MSTKVFDTDKRIRLGIWGLGRGANFVQSAKFLNIDVVAGCDIHPEIRERFQNAVPEAFCTADEKEFLAYDMDAVLVATYLPDHARHSIMALEAGKHVMCEVTAFRTPADAVKLVEAVEKSGKVYNMLENYPFTPACMYMKKLYQEGYFGEFMYGEFEYLHECRTLTYGYNVYPVSLPVEPGWTVHNWRSTLNIHLYCTHSLGPAMFITGTRPVSVSAVRDEVTLPGYLRHASAAPSIVKMSNGALVRNLMGSTTLDCHNGMRFWGTKAAAESREPGKLNICCGAFGGGLLMDVEPEIDELAKLAADAAHGGGDFWELYYFAREILTGEPAPGNIYASCDVTMTGIMAIRSEKQGGKSIRIPDMRNPGDRELCRYDCEDELPFHHEHIFPEGHDPAVTGEFSTVMTKLFPILPGGLNVFNAAINGIRLYDNIKNDKAKFDLLKCLNTALKELPEIAENCRKAERIRDAYPDCIAGKMLTEMLAAQDLKRIYDVEGTAAELIKWRDSCK